MPKNSASPWRLFKVLLKNMRLILLISLIFGVVFFFGLHYIVPPTYTANVTVYINNSQQTAQGNQKIVSQVDLMVSEILIPTYERLLRSNIALEDILRRSGLSGYTTGSISSAISTSSKLGTAILKIYVTDKIPENAARIANATIGTLTEVVASQIEGSSVVVIDYASIPNISSSFSREINAGIGVALGFILSTIYFYIIASKKAVITSKDDIRQILGIPLLGVIPYMEDKENSSKKLP